MGLLDHGQGLPQVWVSFCVGWLDPGGGTRLGAWACWISLSHGDGSLPESHVTWVGVIIAYLLIIFIESHFDVSADFAVYRGVAPNRCMYTSAPPRVGGGTWDGASGDHGSIVGSGRHQQGFVHFGFFAPSLTVNRV